MAGLRLAWGRGVHSVEFSQKGSSLAAGCRLEWLGFVKAQLNQVLGGFRFVVSVLAFSCSQFFRKSVSVGPRSKVRVSSSLYAHEKIYL